MNVPVYYGSRNKLLELSPSEVEVNVATKQSLAFAVVLLNLLEISGMFAFGPEVGVALELANASGQTYINYEETGKVDATTAGINFASVIIPGILTGVKGIKNSSKVAAEAVETTEAGIAIAKEITQVSENSVVAEIRNSAASNEESKLLSSIISKTELSSKEIAQLRNLIEDGEISNLKRFQAILNKSFSRTDNSLIGAAITGTKSKSIIKLLSRTETTSMKLSRLASKSMQWTTKSGGYLISPSSLAADVISKTVAKITSKVESFGEEIASKMKKWIKLGKKGLAKAEDEFVRTGGILFKSKWIMGYKILQEDDISATIIIQFKNSHPNVITKVSYSNLKAWAETSRGSWYINNIARSRGGKSLAELGIEGQFENFLGMLPIGKINEIVGFASFSKGFISQIRANKGTLIWHSGEYIEGFKNGLIQGVINEALKSAVSLGTQNQYAKQILEGGFGMVSSGTSFGVAFSSSFASSAQSMRDTVFEDTTKTGSIVKNVKVIKGTGSSLKGLT